MELSILIPSRNEMFLARTIQDILENIEAETEVIALLDGQWSDPPVPQNDRVNIIYVPEAIGQREGTSMAVRLAKGKYIMKVDAHCAFDKGFDRKMIDFFKEHGDNMTAVPIMRNLWAFDWKCYNCGWKKYQSPTPEKCPDCGSTNVKRKMMWVGKKNPQSVSYCFDAEPHFQYFEDYKHRKGKDGKTNHERGKEIGWSETMSLQGSCWMMTREKYIDYKPTREQFGSCGNDGIEIACREWLSGGKVLVNYNTWYAHMFRTQGGDFGFPYHNSGKHVCRTKRRVWELFRDKKFKDQIYPVSWLVEKFWPVPGWNEEDLKKLKKVENG